MTAKRSQTCTIASTTSAATARARAQRRCSRGWVSPKRGTAIPSPSFSGGWRMRFNLAQALMCRSDLLLLDEPTNHLDLDAVLWLEDWLAKYPGTLLLITHDRDFLDGVVEVIVHVNARKLEPLHRQLRAVRARAVATLALQQASYAKQQRQVAHLHSFIDRFRAKATKAKQAQSRIKALERMELIAAAHVDISVRVRRFRPSTPPRGNSSCSSTRRWAMKASRRCSPTSTGAFSPAIASGCSGPNGAGKSTLLKAIAGTLAPRAGNAFDGAEPAARLFRAAPGRTVARGAIRRCGTCGRSSPTRASRSCAISWAASTFAATWPVPPSVAFPAARRRG